MSQIGLQKCGCVKHEEFVQDKAFTLKKIDQRPYRKCVIDFLSSNNLLTKYSKYLCTVCALKAEAILDSKETDDDEPKSKKSKTNYVDIVISEIESDSLNDPDMCRLASAIGLSQREKFASEAAEVTSKFRTDLSSYNPYNFETNCIVLAFLSSLVGIGNVNKCDSKPRLLSFRAAIDCLLATANLYTVTPLFFALNLIMYFVCGSKVVVNFLSSLTPSGSYTSVRNWFKCTTTDEISCPKNTDIVTFFDNNQVLARNWRIRYDSKAMLSVITSVVHIKQCDFTLYQYLPEMDPKSWLYNPTLNCIAVVERINNYIKDSIKIINSERNKYVCQRLNKVYNEHRSADYDIIDTFVNEPDTIIEKGNTNNDNYTHIPHQHPTNPPKVINGRAVPL